MFLYVLFSLAHGGRGWRNMRIIILLLCYTEHHKIKTWKINKYSVFAKYYQGNVGPAVFLYMFMKVLPVSNKYNSK